MVLVTCQRPFLPPKSVLLLPGHPEGLPKLVMDLALQRTTSKKDWPRLCSNHPRVTPPLVVWVSVAPHLALGQGCALLVQRGDVDLRFTDNNSNKCNRMLSTLLEHGPYLRLPTCYRRSRADWIAGNSWANSIVESCQRPHCFLHTSNGSTWTLLPHGREINTSKQAHPENWLIDTARRTRIVQISSKYV